jgi:hypothetical protein
MKISDDEQYWQQIAVHTHARNSNGSPWSTQMQVAALVGGDAIAAAVSRYTPDASSTWDIFAVTEDGRLVRVLMDFALDRYDYEEEQDPFRKQNPVASNVREAWVRRLSDVVRLDVGKVRRRVDSFRHPLRDHLDVGDVHLAFADGSKFDLGIDQLAMYDADGLAATDAFLDAVRSHAGL